MPHDFDNGKGVISRYVTIDSNGVHLEGSNRVASMVE